MSNLRRFLPWYDEGEDEMKDARAEVAVSESKKVEDRVRKLAERYHAVGIAVKQTRTVVVTK